LKVRVLRGAGFEADSEAPGPPSCFREAKRVKNSTATIAAPKGREALLIVCRACESDPKSLRRQLRDAARARAGKRAIRVVASSCLDLCPNDAVAVACAAGGTTRYAIVPPGTDPAGVLELFTLPTRADSEASAGAAAR